MKRLIKMGADVNARSNLGRGVCHLKIFISFMYILIKTIRRH